MRKVLIPLGLAAGMVAGVSANAGAIAIGAAGMKEAATISSPLEQVQYSEHRTRHGHPKGAVRKRPIQVGDRDLHGSALERRT